MRIPSYSTLVVALLIAIAAVVFAFQNDDEIVVRFIKWTVQGSAAVVLLTTFALGVVATTLALLPTLMRAIGQASASKRHAKKLSKEVAGAKEHAHELVQEVAKARGAAEEAEKLTKPAKPSGGTKSRKK